MDLERFQAAMQYMERIDEQMEADDEQGRPGVMGATAGNEVVAEGINPAGAGVVEPAMPGNGQPLPDALTEGLQRGEGGSI
jgi:hypothetical protein